MTALAYMTLGAIVLVLGLVWTRGPRRGASALILFFVGTAAVISPLLVGGEAETAYFVSLLMSLPSALMLAPAFGRYVDLTTTKDDGSSLRRFALGHFVLPAVGGLVAGAYGLLSRPDRELMLVHGQLPDGTLAASIALATFILVLLWVPQSAFYLYYAAARIVRQYARARTHPNGGWQLLPPSIVGSVWLVVATALLGDNLFGYSPVGLTTVAAMALVVTWSMAIWTLSTNPNPQPEPALEHAAKYERSALRPPRAQRIVAKLDDVMATKRLYLDSDLTLERLADAVGAPRNYVSQALNGTLGESFFEYVSRHRIEAAKPMVLVGEKTMVEIAVEVGFNARSTFYKAFKRATGQTPGEFRSSRKTSRTAQRAH